MKSVNESISLCGDWARYLEKRGQRILKDSLQFSFSSRDAERRCSRWVFFSAEGASRSLPKWEREALKFHMDRATERGEAVFAVIEFSRPASKVLVLPANKAIGLSRIFSTRGGIPWEE